jgi:hypothetical protein
MSLANALMICLVMTAFSCSKDNNKNTNKETPNNNVSNNEAPDPEGTITVNISENTEAILQVGIYYTGIVSWIPPDNLYIEAGLYYRVVDHRLTNYPRYVSICNLGKMKGLGNITQIPQTGFSNPAKEISSIACESGHGYVLKFEDIERHESQPVYARLYVVEPIVSIYGGIMGAKVKYQYPFEP